MDDARKVFFVTAVNTSSTELKKLSIPDKSCERKLVAALYSLANVKLKMFFGEDQY